MQTTLRIDDHLYREAKAEAAREGISLTRFLEEALRLKLGGKPATLPGKPHSFRVYAPEKPPEPSIEEICRIADDDLEKYELAKLGVPWNKEN